MLNPELLAWNAITRISIDTHDWFHTYPQWPHGVCYALITTKGPESAERAHFYAKFVRLSSFSESLSWDYGNIVHGHNYL